MYKSIPWTCCKAKWFQLLVSLLHSVFLGENCPNGRAYMQDTCHFLLCIPAFLLWFIMSSYQTCIAFLAVTIYHFMSSFINICVILNMFISWLNLQGIPVAPLWDSFRGQFVGLLSPLDFILILREVSFFLLCSLLLVFFNFLLRWFSSVIPALN